MFEQLKTDIEKILKKGLPEDQTFCDIRKRYAKELEIIKHERNNENINEEEFVKRCTKAYIYVSELPLMKKYIEEEHDNIIDVSGTNKPKENPTHGYIV